jgi:hypothetical protein
MGNRPGSFLACSSYWLIYPWNDLAAHAHLIVAGAAIHRAIILWQERDLCLCATLSTNYAVHLAWSALTSGHTSTATLGAACRTACWAASRLVHQALLLVELLLTGGEYEILTALTTPERFVCEAQLGTSL